MSYTCNPFHISVSSAENIVKDICTNIELKIRWYKKSIKLYYSQLLNLNKSIQNHILYTLAMSPHNYLISCRFDKDRVFIKFCLLIKFIRRLTCFGSSGPYSSCGILKKFALKIQIIKKRWWWWCGWLTLCKHRACYKDFPDQVPPTQSTHLMRSIVNHDFDTRLRPIKLWCMTTKSTISLCPIHFMIREGDKIFYCYGILFSPVGKLNLREAII